MFWGVSMSQRNGEETENRWIHPGGKLRDVGAENLSDAELLAVLISTGIPGKSAEQISQEILAKFGSFRGIAAKPLDRFLAIKGLGDVKVLRIAAAFEIAKRIVNEVLDEQEEESK